MINKSQMRFALKTPVKNDMGRERDAENEIPQ